MTTNTTHEVADALAQGHEVSEAPGGAYYRVMVPGTKRAAAWVLRLKKGEVRLILRTKDTPPKSLAEGQMIEAKTGNAQFRLGSSDVKRGRQLIDWALRAATPAEAPVLAAAKEADKPVARKRTRARKPALKVVKSDA
jgi:hypothetical protein